MAVVGSMFPADPTGFDKVREGDSVRVRYQTGKYTGTIRGAEILR